MSEIDWSKAPEGATHYAPAHGKFNAMWAKYDGKKFKFYENLNGRWFDGEQPMADEKFIVRPQPLAWNGEGLPPAGIECEYRGAHQYDEWSVVKIFAELRGVVFIDFHDGWRDERDPSRFRPLRTAEQIAADEREKSIVEIEELILGYGYRKCAELIHDAGYRKQEPQHD